MRPSKAADKTVEPEEEHILNNVEIRSMSPVDSRIFDASYYKVITFFIKNTLDKSVTVQVKANRVNSAVGAVYVGPPVAVGASGAQNSITARTLTPQNDGWLPYYFVTVTSAENPTSGYISVHALGRN